MKRLLATFIASRAGLWLVAAAAWAWLPKGRFFKDGASLWESFRQWDAGWYVNIIENGYSYVPGQASSVAFFPLYPWLCRPLAVVTNPWIAGTVVSGVALLAAAFVMGKWIQALSAGVGAAETPEAPVATALLFLCPVTVFHGAVYSESLFLLLAAGVFWGLEKGRWPVVVLCAYLAALTRSAGITLMVLIAWRAWELRHAGPLRPAWGWLVAALAAPAAAVFTYMGFLAWKFGEPLAFSQTQTAWGRGLTWPWRTLLPEHLKIYPPFYLVWFLFFLGLAVGLLVLGWRRVPRSYVGYAAGSILFFLASGRLESCPRYLSALLPLYLIGARLLAERPGARLAWYITCGVLAAVSVTLFVNGFWFT